MGKIVEHYIIMKYNLGVFRKSGAEEWMRHRTELFEKYCYPSLQAQTCKDFKVLALIDENTPKEWYEKYDFIPLLMSYKNFVPCKEYLKKNCKTPWIITTRVDNDDWIAPKFIEEIQKCFHAAVKTIRSKLVIDVYGDKLYTEMAKNPKLRGKIVPASHYPGSHFISLVEKTNDIRTVRCGEHRKMPAKYPFRIIRKNLYKEVIHDRNVANC